MFDTRAMDERLEREALQTVPKTPWELFDLEHDRQRLESNSNSIVNAVSDEWEERLDEIERITGTRPKDPTSAWDFTLSPFFEGEGDPSSRRTDNVGATRAQYKKLAEEANAFIRNNKGEFPELVDLPADVIGKAAASRIKGAVEDADEAQRTTSGWGDWISGAGGSVWAGIKDPANALAAVAGVATGGGSSILTLALTEAAAAGITELALEPSKIQTAEFAGLPKRTKGRAASDVATAAAGGFVLTGALAGAAKGAGKLIPNKKLQLLARDRASQKMAMAILDPGQLQQATTAAHAFEAAVHTQPLSATPLGRKILNTPFKDQAPEARMAERINDIKVESKPDGVSVEAHIAEYTVAYDALLGPETRTAPDQAPLTVPAKETLDTATNPTATNPTATNARAVDAEEIAAVNENIIQKAVADGEIDLTAPLYFEGPDGPTARTMQELVGDVEIEERVIFELADCAGL